MNKSNNSGQTEHKLLGKKKVVNIITKNNVPSLEDKIKDAMSPLNELMKGAMPSLKDKIKDAMTPLNELTKDDVPSLEDRIKNAMTPLTRTQIKNLFLGLNSFFKEAGELLKKEGDIELNYKTIIVELGYAPHKELPDDYKTKIVDDYDKHGKMFVARYIDEMMFNYYNKQTIDEIAQKWEEKNLAKSRIHILRDVAKCHNLRMYNVSIPALLPQFDGIITDAFSHTGRLYGGDTRTYLDKLLNKNFTNEDSFKEAFYEYYTKNLLAQFEFGKEISSDVSRHAILHGGDKNYGKKSNSLKLILIFDFLLMSLENVYTDTI